MDLVKRFLEKINNNSTDIVVVGDFILDEYYEVSARRLSPEAPVPVLRSHNETSTVYLGGAGNVADFILNFDIIPRLFSLINPYSKEVLNKNKIDAFNCICSKDFNIPVKKRFYDGKHYLMRWDIESETDDYGIADLKATRSIIFNKFNDYLIKNKTDVVILSDYGKGLFDDELCNKLIKLCNNLDITTIVDPKKAPLSKWTGCSVFKPNQVEAYELSGVKDWRQQCDYFIDNIGCKSVIITQQGDGVCGKNCDYFDYQQNKKINVENVAGAGDSYIAVLAMALSNGFTLKEAAEIAFETSRVYVQKSHHETLTKYELLKNIDPQQAKLVTPEFLANRNFSLAFANGVYDIIHQQHINLLKFAKTKADKIVVAVNSDESVRQLKGSQRPFMCLTERMQILSSLEFVDFVVSFNELTPLNLIKVIKPDSIVKADEYKKEEVVGYAEVNGNVYLFPYQKGTSSTNYINKLRKQ